MCPYPKGYGLLAFKMTDTQKKILKAVDNAISALTHKHLVLKIGCMEQYYFLTGVEENELFYEKIVPMVCRELEKETHGSPVPAKLGRFALDTWLKTQWETAPAFVEDFAFEIIFQSMTEQGKQNIWKKYKRL